jgi:hypothetical protein
MNTLIARDYPSVDLVVNALSGRGLVAKKVFEVGFSLPFTPLLSLII